MPCSRCAGLTVPEVMRDGGSCVVATRCVICGDLVDHVIIHHRTHVARPHRNRARTPIFNRKRNESSRHHFAASARVTHP